MGAQFKCYHHSLLKICSLLCWFHTFVQFCSTIVRTDLPEKSRKLKVTSEMSSCCWGTNNVIITLSSRSVLSFVGFTLLISFAQQLLELVYPRKLKSDFRNELLLLGHKQCYHHSLLKICSLLCWFHTFDQFCSTIIRTGLPEKIEN